MSFNEFKLNIHELGAQALDRGNGHWQVKVGAVVINYYPASANQTIYINSVPMVTASRRYHKAQPETVYKLVQEFKEKLSKEKSNDTFDPSP